jgi:hypothetical protein
MTSLNPLAPVTDYQSMLNRIFWFTTAAALVAIWMLRLYIRALDELLHRIDFTVEFGGNKVLPIPGGYLFPALAVGIMTRVFRFHARISDWLRIREWFDIQVIIRELAAQLGIDLSEVSDERLADARHNIMRKAFYAYVGGPQPLIDQQLVQQALDAWSWFWAGVEVTLVFVLTSLVLIAGSAYEIGFLTLGGTILFALNGLPAMRSQCQRYAIAQVRAIVADSSRATAVRSAFTELMDHQHSGRRAA